MKHTPGPWNIESGFSDWGMPKQITIFAKQKTIATIESVTPYCIGASAKELWIAQEALANARLIAAAPDLLEALEDALGHLSFECAEGGCTCGNGWSHAPKELERKIIAAIRLAEEGK